MEESRSGKIQLREVNNMNFIGIMVGSLAESLAKKRGSVYEQITLGMPEKEMLGIMGSGYSRSLLKNNRTKYEWRYSNGSSYGTYGHGMSMRTYSGVIKVIIYCKDGVVEEVRPYNC